MATARVNGIDIYYEEHGDGEPLLLIMGLGANTTNWWARGPDLSAEFRVITFDNQGAGRSEKPARPYSMAQMADDTAGLLDALDVDSAHVFGMSMGAAAPAMNAVPGVNAAILAFLREHAAARGATLTA